MKVCCIFILVPVKKLQYYFKCNEADFCLVLKILKQMNLSVNRLKLTELPALSSILNLALWQILKICSEKHSGCEVLISPWFYSESLLCRLKVTLSTLHTLWLQHIVNMVYFFLFSQCPSVSGHAVTLVRSTFKGMTIISHQTCKQY